MASEPTRFGLIRHGRTVWNREKRIQGWQDSPLTAKGEELVRQWAGELAPLDWELIVHSDLGRARRTAELINGHLGLECVAEPGLREQNWGEWSGLRLPELRKDKSVAVARQEAAGWAFTPPGGESREQVLARSRAALMRIHNRWPGRRVLLVVHEGVIKCLLYHLAGRLFLPNEPPLLDKGYFLHLLAWRENRPVLEKMHALALTREVRP